MFDTPGAPRTLRFAALKHVSWLWNHFTTRANPGGVSPIKMLTGRKPNLSTVMPWGQCVGTHIRRDTMGTHPKGEEGIFIGSDVERKGCMVYSKRSRKVITTQHVRIIDRSPITPSIQAHETNETENKDVRNVFSLIRIPIGEVIDEKEDTADVDNETLIRKVQVLPTQASDLSTTRIVDCRAGSSQAPPGTRRSSRYNVVTVSYTRKIP